MRYYPVFVDLAGKPAVVVGGGAVAQRKVEVLLECGARVRVIAPRFTEGLRERGRDGSVELVERSYREGDLAGAFISFACTDDHTVNVAVHDEAARNAQLCNVVDVPDLCSFIVPSIIERGDLTIAVSTSGNSPALAKRVKREIAGFVGEEWGTLNDILGRLRPELKRRHPEEGPRNEALERLMSAGVLDLIREGRLDEAEELAWRCL
jgi:precorrin-2 dehydrogenase/sirohydrochlorin ferrochelatase